MFTDPQIITVNSVAKSMPRILTSGLSATYQNADESFKMTLSHTKSNKRIRSMVRVDQRAIVADPLSSENDYETLGVYLIIDRPEVGFSLAQVQQLVAAHHAWLDGTAVGQIYGQES